MIIAGILYKRWGSREPVADSVKPVVISRESSIGSRQWSIVINLFVLTAIGLWLMAFSFHPYYMSVTEMEYKPAEKEIQVSSKIFIGKFIGL